MIREYSCKQKPRYLKAKAGPLESLHFPFDLFVTIGFNDVAVASNRKTDIIETHKNRKKVTKTLLTEKIKLVTSNFNSV